MGKLTGRNDKERKVKGGEKMTSNGSSFNDFPALKICF